MLVYIFLSFSIGLACLGVTLVLAKRKDSHLARAFLAFYAVLSLLVISGLLLAFADVFPREINPSTHFVLEYIESIPGFYGVMFTLPFFVHRVYGVASRARDRFLLSLTLLAALGQHITEYALDDKWDQRGDTIENGLFVAVVTYAYWIAFSRFRSEGIDRRLAIRILALMVVGVPGMFYDIFLADTTGLRVYPIMYCILSVIVTWTLVNQPSTAQRLPPNTDFGLSKRESEVMHLVQRGLSNKGIGEKLHISPNTVKTHLRAVFEKTGVRSRFELIAQTNERTEDLLQTEDDSIP
ncbi:MAG: helix-turn-helix transcriptional regulator [bacterium]|nr:helix-turn-helix transcriptional regulator [bacterium]